MERPYSNILFVVISKEIADDNKTTQSLIILNCTKSWMLWLRTKLEITISNHQYIVIQVKQFRKTNKFT